MASEKVSEESLELACPVCGDAKARSTGAPFKNAWAVTCHVAGAHPAWAVKVAPTSRGKPAYEKARAIYKHVREQLNPTGTKTNGLGAAIRGRRAVLNMRQTQLAELVDLPKSYISEIESGKKIPSTEVQHRLAKQLQLTIHQLSDLRLSAADQEAAVEPRALQRVLWVDDHPEWNIAESLELERRGYVITHTTDTDAALLYLSQVRFDLVITDLERGHDSSAGIELLHQIRDSWPELPVLIYTGAHSERTAAASDLGSIVLTDPQSLVASSVAVLQTRA